MPSHAGDGTTRPARGGSDDGLRPAIPIRVIGDDTEQANLVLGMRGLSRHDPRRFAVGVLSAALGGGMSSRLFQRIREERGLAYSVYSFTQAYADTGQFGVYAGCQPGKADEVLDLMSAELDAAAHGALSAAEIERGKGQMRGGIVLGLEDSGSRMTRIGKSELSYGDDHRGRRAARARSTPSRRTRWPRWPPSCSHGRAASPSSARSARTTSTAQLS